MWHLYHEYSARSCSLLLPLSQFRVTLAFSLRSTLVLSCSFPLREYRRSVPRYLTSFRQCCTTQSSISLLSVDIWKIMRNVILFIHGVMYMLTLETAFDRALDLHFRIAGYFAVRSPEAAATAIARQCLLVAGSRVSGPPAGDAQSRLRQKQHSRGRRWQRCC